MALSKTQEAGRWVASQLREKGTQFLQSSWDWALKHPALTKYLLISGGFSFLMWFHSMRLRYVRSNTIIELDLDGKEIVEKVDPLSQLLNPNVISLQTVLESLYQAAKDRRVIGLVAKLGNTKATRTQWQEIRDALKNFRSSGKKAICFSEAFAEYGSGTALFWVASAFDEIYTTPYSTLHLIALRIDMPFMRGTLQKLDVEPHAVRRSEYKTALEQFTEEKFTEPARANWTGVLEAFNDQFASDIAEYLKKTPEEVKKIISDGPYSATAAKEMGLITDTAYLGDFMANIVPKAFGRPDIKHTNLLFFKLYYKNVGSRYNKGRNAVALINVSGNIMMGDEGDASHEVVIQALRQAGDDKKIKVVIIRVDSPGGSALASDLMWREIMRLREEKDKKVIVSMGSMAASGGYYIACPADRILALPLTITGSIGVFAGKMNTRGLWKKIGVNHDDISLGENAGLFSALEGFSPENKERIERFVEEIYTRFKECVSKGRNMSPEAAENVAKGRVWMGQKALELGLVDRIGGFEAAIDEARKMMNLAVDAPIRLRSFPRDQSIIKSLLGSRNSLDQQTANTSFWWTSLAGAVASIPMLGRSISTFIRAALLFSRNVSALSSSPEVGAVVNAVTAGNLVAQESALAMVESPIIM